MTVNGKEKLAHRDALRYTAILRECLLQTDDTEEAILSAQLAMECADDQGATFTACALSLEPIPPSDQDGGMFFAHDIFSRVGQGILNRSLDKAKGLSADARDALRKALKITDPAKMATAIIEAITKYRLQLASLLTTTQLASLLAGAKEVVQQIPVVPMFPSSPPPVSLEPQEALDLVERLRDLEPMQREEEIIKLSSAEQQFVRHQLIAEQQQPAVPPPPLSVTRPERGEPGRIHFPIIDEAAAELSKKNVIDRAGFDRLDEAARAKAFTVTGVDAQETLEKIRDAIAENIAEGADVQAGREKILASVDEGTFLSPAHLETVLRVAIQTAFTDGQFKILQHPYVRSGFPFVRWTAIDDDRVRHDHLAMEWHGLNGGPIYRVDDPTFLAWKPPADFNCRCGFIVLTVRMAAEAGVTSAQKWLETGIEPEPEYVPYIPPPNPAFRKSLSGAPLSIQLSLRMPIEAEFSVDAEGHKHKGKGKGGGQFTGDEESASTGLDKTPKGKTTGTPAYHPGSAHGSAVSVKAIKKRVFNGEPIPVKTTLTKQETGRVAEAVALAYLKTIKGFKDARPMNTEATNFPIDMIEDHAPTEVKGGLVSNARKSQQWRLTFSKTSKAENEAYEKMTPQEREEWNQHKQRRIKERKAAVIKSLEKKYGKPIKPRTLTVIINPDTKTADVFIFDGFHDRIDWQMDIAKKSYVGSVSYGH
jgi:hypothetical protein